MSGPLNRREFLAAASVTTGTLLFGSNNAEELDVSFFLIGDTHYLADKEQPEKLDARSAATTSRLIEQLNRLPGTKIPDMAGGGTVIRPKGLIHAGDLIDSGDKNGSVLPKMQQTEWAAYVDEFGLTGRDGKLKYPVYEVHGNHDSPQGDGLVIKKITERNKNRPGLANISKNGLHCSWDWGSVHFVNLGIVVGSLKEPNRKRRYNALDSLEFLVGDLAEKVGTSGRPIVLTHHVDMIRYSSEPDPQGPATTKEWDPCDVRGYYDALKAYNIIAILYGHTHVRNVFKWNGTTMKSDKGIATFNVDNGAHFASDTQAFFYFHLRNGEMTVREFATKDRWQTGDWTPQTWTSKFEVKKG